MKTLLSLIFIQFSIFAYPGDPALVCLELTYSSDTAECIGIVNRGYINEQAVKVCGGLTYDSDSNDCLRASLNKVFSQAEGRVCASLAYGSDSVKCMKNAGRPIGLNQGDNCSSRHDRSNVKKLREIERLGSKVKRQIRRGDLTNALKNVVTIITLAASK